MNRAVFLDRDGVINEISEGEFIRSPEELRIIKGVPQAIKILNSLGLKVIIATNTPQVARGVITEEEASDINNSLVNKLEEEGVLIDAVYFCPHHPEKHHPDIKHELMKYRIECECRKPNIGMIRQAGKDLGIDIANSFIIGDRTVDVKAGERAGCRTILLKTGVGGSDNKEKVQPDFVLDDLGKAVELIQQILRIKTLFLVGGEGRRLKPLTEKLPKPMLPINSKPLLEHLINLNKKHGIENFVMSGHYLFNKIRDYFGDGSRFGVNIEYVNDGELPRGSGGAVKNCSDKLPENFIAMSGDVITNINLWELIKFHFSKNGIATLVIRKTDHPHDSDLLEIDGDFKAVKFYNKHDPNKKGDLANASPFVFKKGIISFIGDGESNLENDIISKVIEVDDVYCYLNTKYLIKDIGTPERYSEVKNLQVEF